VGNPGGDFSDIYHAFITGPNGSGMRDIGILVEKDAGVLFPDIDSYATGINDAGQVIGNYQVACHSCGGSGSFITGPNGINMRAGFENSYFEPPSDINNSGQVVAGSFIKGPAGTIPLPGSGYAINDAGQVAGKFAVGSEYHAFITGPDGSEFHDLGTFGESFSVATDVNSAGQAVGYFGGPNSDPHHAFVTGPDGKGMTNLDAVIYLPGGAHLREAVGINNAGQIIVNGTNNGYLLTPIPAPIPEPASYALMFAGLGLISVMARLKSGKSSHHPITLKYEPCPWLQL
jgi:probable HAF family extracellular repeat protein